MPLLFTADDAGASVEVNEAIRLACTEGHVNSVAYLVNLPDFGDACERIAPVAPQRSVHLNLVEGRPLALDASSPLVDAEGWFAFQSTGLLRAYYRAPATTKARIVSDARTEIGAQLLAFAEAFDGPVAIDSHQHVHMFPFVLPQVMAAADELGLPISRLRWPVEKVRVRDRFTSGGLKATALSVMARRGQDLVPDATPRTHAFCGVVHTGHMTAQVARSFISDVAKMPSVELAELLIHPGGGSHITEAWARQPALREFYTSTWRIRELDVARSTRLPAP